VNLWASTTRGGRYLVSARFVSGQCQRLAIDNQSQILSHRPQYDNCNRNSWRPRISCGVPCRYFLQSVLRQGHHHLGNAVRVPRCAKDPEVTSDGYKNACMDVCLLRSPSLVHLAAPSAFLFAISFRYLFIFFHNSSSKPALVKLQT
jgi:hypothetical protein